MLMVLRSDLGKVLDVPAVFLKVLLHAVSEHAWSARAVVLPDGGCVFDFFDEGVEGCHGVGTVGEVGAEGAWGHAFETEGEGAGGGAGFDPGVGVEEGGGAGGTVLGEERTLEMS